MSHTVDVPLWALLILLLASALYVLRHMLLPSARWFFRRRANAVIHEVNDRLALQIPSFKLTRREVLVDRLVYNPRVLSLVETLAAEREVTRDALMKEVQVYAREIVPAFNALLYFKTAYWLARRLVHALYRVRLGFADDEALNQLDDKSSVVFLMNHRSNMDYVLATYLAAERTALSYAVGEWARVWPLQQLIRAMGGYFVRRDSGDPLYRRVLECYVQMAADGGVPQAIFPEGGLSRDGTLRAPRMGLLGYLLRGFDPKGERDIVFIPVGINYDRVFEDRSLLLSRDRSNRRGMSYTLWTLTRFIGKNIWQAVLGKRYRYGYACVNFGRPVSLKHWLAEHAEALDSNGADGLSDATPLAEDMMARIGAITPILPVAVVTRIFARDIHLGLSELELKSRVLDELATLEAAGHRAYIPRGDHDYAVTVGVRMLTLRSVLLEIDGVYQVNPEEVDLLNYYANSIAHLPVD